MNIKAIHLFIKLQLMYRKLVYSAVSPKESLACDVF